MHSTELRHKRPSGRQTHAGGHDRPTGCRPRLAMVACLAAPATAAMLAPTRMDMTALLGWSAVGGTAHALGGVAMSVPFGKW